MSPGTEMCIYINLPFRQWNLSTERCCLQRGGAEQGWKFGEPFIGELKISPSGINDPT